MTVYLVGAGPGGPELLTVRALRLLERADLVVHDRLVDRGTLELVRAGAELVDVGKSPFVGGASQESINALLIERGRSELVVRLKGGDPYVFGRGGEEALALESAGVAYEVVPGVSAVAAVPAAAGVPLTMRKLTSTVVVVTGHDPDGATSSPIAWDALGGDAATIVFVMAVAQRAEIAKRLIAAGRSPSTPAVVIERGATPELVSHRTTLSELGALAVTSPATIVVGEVASLELASIEARQLHGRRIALTRARGESAELADLLADAGARVLEVPTIELARDADGLDALRVALGGELPAWIVCTSPHGAEALFEAVLDARALGGVRVGAVGPATAARLLSFGVRADLVASPASVKGLLEGFPRPELGDARVVYPRARGASPELAEGLRAIGYDVDDPVVYETRPRRVDPTERDELLGADAIVLSSPSALLGLLGAVARFEIQAALVTIGPTTSAAVRAEGLVVAAESAEPSAEALLVAVRSLLGPRGGGSLHS